MKDDLTTARQILAEQNCTLVLVKGDTVYKSHLRGVAPMLELIDKGADLRGFSAADKVVGRGAAMLFAYTGIIRVHSALVSKIALKCLNQFEIHTEFDTLCDNIINRKGDGICPIEKAVAECEDPAEGVEIIRKKLSELKG